MDCICVIFVEWFEKGFCDLWFGFVMIIDVCVSGDF